MLTTLETIKISPEAVAHVMAAQNAQSDFVPKAILAGQILLECVNTKLCSSWTNDSVDASPDATLEEIIAEYFPTLRRVTALRWMAAAKRVMCVLHELHHAFPAIELELDGEKQRISYVLTAPESDCSRAMLTFRESFDIFLKDKTLSEATEATLDGESEAHRITRAANGKRKGGKGGNRRAYARFIAAHFKAMGSIARKWDKLMQSDPGEYARMAEVIRATVLGGAIKLHEKGRPFDCRPWPVSFTKLIGATCKERLHDVKRADS